MREINIQFESSDEKKLESNILALILPMLGESNCNTMCIKTNKETARKIDIMSFAK